MIFQYNENKFLDKCKKSKVDGLIVVDLPYPENKSFASKCKKNGVNFIQLVSPTTSQIRLKKIIQNHVKMTSSVKGEDILSNWDKEVSNFKKVMPTEFKRVLTSYKKDNMSKVAGE